MAVAWVECKCTTAPASGRAVSTARCMKTSFEGFFPPMWFQSKSSLLMPAASSRPSEELVGVIK